MCALILDEWSQFMSCLLGYCNYVLSLSVCVCVRLNVHVCVHMCPCTYIGVPFKKQLLHGFWNHGSWLGACMWVIDVYMCVDIGWMCGHEPMYLTNILHMYVWH